MLRRLIFHKHTFQNFQITCELVDDKRMLQNRMTLAAKTRMEWDQLQVGGVAERDLRTLVDFMYHGQLEVRHCD